MHTPREPAETFDRLIDWDTSLTPRDEFMESVTGDEQLRVKFGADITAPTLHLGHGVNLRAMRQMQDMGHKVVFLLGGFTTLVGDPTDKLQSRSAPEIADMEENKQQFVEQVGTILRFDDPELIEVRDNTEWWGGEDVDPQITPLELFRVLGDINLSQLLARDMFKKRLADGTPIKMSEFLYPVLQGYDSVMMDSDVTVVGSDQLFNESMGRELQERAGQDKQMVVCTKITPGLDGGQKQSKSVGNYVGISHSPEEKYNRLMRLKDDLTGQWLEVYSDLPLDEVERVEITYLDQPLERKKILASNITAMFHGEDAAAMASQNFDRKMQRRAPTEIPELVAGEGDNLRNVLMHQLGHKASGVKQFIDNGSLVRIEDIDEQGAFSDIILTNEDVLAPVEPGTVFRVGKNKFYRIAAHDPNDSTVQD